MMTKINNASFVPPRRALWPLGILLCPLAATQAQGATEETVLSEVSVTASAQSQEIRRNAAAGKIVFDRKELDALDAASMGELLGKLPGAGMFADPDSGGPRGRGRGPDRNMPTILVDGQPLPGGGRNPAAALRLPVELIERVEIIRNSTAEFPVLSPGGVINLILRDVPNKLTRGAKVGIGLSDGEPALRLEGQYGEPDGGAFGYLLSGAFNSRPQVGSHRLEATTYSGGIATGTLQEQSKQSGRDDNLTLSPRFTWNLGDGQRLSLTPFLTHTETRRDFAVDRNSSGVFSADRDGEETKRSTGRLMGEWKSVAAGGAETSARVMLQSEHERADKATNKYDGSGVLTSATQESTVRDEFEKMLELRSKRLLADAHLLTGAVEWRDKASDDRRNRSAGSPDAATLNEERKVLWVQDEWQVSEQHVLTPGLRYQLLHTRIDDASSGTVERTHRALDPSLHYLWQFNDGWNFRASMARTTRVPFTRDLSPLVRQASGTNSSGNPDRGGNPQLEPERLRSLELGVEHFLAERAGTIGVSIFDRQIDNYSQRLIQQESGRWVERPSNVGTAEVRGVLFDFKSKLGVLGLPDLTLRGNLAYTDTRMLQQVAGLGAGEGPRKSANLGWDYELPAYRTTLGGNLNYVSALDRESSATIKQLQGARRQLDLYALYKLDRQLSLRFSAQNVLRDDRTNSLQEVDGNGLLQRTETERTPGLATYFVTLEAKW